MTEPTSRSWTELFEPIADGGTLTLDIPPGYEQGRGAFGGLLLGGVTRAMERTLGDDARALRSLTAEIVGPVLPGRVRVDVVLLRAGSAVTTLAATLHQNDETLVHAVGVFGRGRGIEMCSSRDVRIEVEDWRTAAVVDVGPPIAPVFAQHVEFRPRAPFPFSGGTEAAASAWVRPKNAGPSRGAAFLVGMADTVWPTVLATVSVPRPVATVAFSLQIVGTLDGLDPEAPLLHKARLLGSSEGYFAELRELYGHDGRLLTLNEQTFVVIK